MCEAYGLDSTRIIVYSLFECLFLLSLSALSVLVNASLFTLPVISSCHIFLSSLPALYASFASVSFAFLPVSSFWASFTTRGLKTASYTTHRFPALSSSCFAGPVKRSQFSETFTLNID